MNSSIMQRKIRQVRKDIAEIVRRLDNLATDADHAGWANTADDLRYAAGGIEQVSADIDHRETAPYG